jgi:hypothetical protein
MDKYQNWGLVLKRNVNGIESTLKVYVPDAFANALHLATLPEGDNLDLTPVFEDIHKWVSNEFHGFKPVSLVPAENL